MSTPGHPADCDCWQCKPKIQTDDDKRRERIADRAAEAALAATEQARHWQGQPEQQTHTGKGQLAMRTPGDFLGGGIFVGFVAAVLAGISVSEDESALLFAAVVVGVVANFLLLVGVIGQGVKIGMRAARDEERIR